MMTRQEAATVIDRFIDGTGGPWDWDDFISTRHRDVVVKRAAEVGVAVGKLYPADTRGSYCGSSGLELLRTLANSLRETPSTQPAGAIVASALEADAAFQEAGALSQLGSAQEQTWVQVAAVAPDYSDAIAFAFTFWDEWTDAANHEWRYHEPIKELDWPRYARAVAAAVRQDRLPDDEILIGHILHDRRWTFRQWLFAHVGR
jgi:hypothetical protein